MVQGDGLTTNPLCSVRVLDFSRAMSGPFCTMLLGDLGMDIIKVEPPGGDETRGWMPPSVNGVSTYFLSVNRNKRSIVIDLTKDGSMRVVDALVRSADILVENFRPGTAAKLGIDYPACSRINRKIIYCSISGYGQSGPLSWMPGFDLTVLAMSGLLGLTGEEGRPPVKFAVPVADMSAGLFAAISILSALYVRQLTGRGQYIDMSMYDASLSLLSHQASDYLATSLDPVRTGNAHPSIAPYQLLATKDGYIALAVGSEKLWKDLCNGCGFESLLEDSRFRNNSERVRHRDELIKIMAARFSLLTTDEALSLLSASGIPCSAVRKVSEVIAERHTYERGLLHKGNHPVYGKYAVVGSPFKLSLTGGTVRRDPPVLGEHSIEILKELDFGDEEIDALTGEGAVLRRSGL
ncbi:MAG: CoA transferase [Methanomassiliicoccales archaeon]